MTTPESNLPRYCKRCDYNLAASLGPVCPECGRGFSPSDSKTYARNPRRKWRRWKWVLAAVLLLVAVWPKGWVLTETTWVDPATSGTVSSRSLLVAHPWWLKGWYPPIGSTSQSGSQTFAAPPWNVSLVIDLRRCDSVLLWRSQVVGRGQLSVLGVPTDITLTPAEWTRAVGVFTRDTADATGADSAEMGGMSIRVRDVQWENLRSRAK